MDNDLFREAEKYLVGGVNSPVRSFRAVGGSPVFIKQGKGSCVYDEPGKAYIDYCLSWGALILGHAYPEVVEKIIENRDCRSACPGGKPAGCADPAGGSGIHGFNGK